VFLSLHALDVAAIAFNARDSGFLLETLFLVSKRGNPILAGVSSFFARYTIAQTRYTIAKARYTIAETRYTIAF